MGEAEAVKAKSEQITGNVSTCKNMWGRHFGVFKTMSGMSERPGFVSHKTTKKQHRPRNTRYEVVELNVHKTILRKGSPLREF